MTWHGYNPIDGVVLLFLLAGFIGGIRRGLSGELVRALVAVAAMAVAILYARPVSEWAVSHGQIGVRAALIGAFLVLLLGAYLSVSIVRKVLSHLADFKFKGPLERWGGGLCGVARAAAVSGLILLLLGLAPNENLHRLVVQESQAGQLATRHLRPLYLQLSERVPEIRVEEPEELLPATPDLPPVEDTAREMLESTGEVLTDETPLGEVLPPE